MLKQFEVPVNLSVSHAVFRLENNQDGMLKQSEVPLNHSASHHDSRILQVFAPSGNSDFVLLAEESHA